MNVTVTMTFTSADEALAFLSNKPPTSKPTAASTQPAADTERTAPAGDAPSGKVLTWDDDVLPALKAYSKKVGNDAFKAYLTKLGVDKVPPLAKATDKWAAIMKDCA